MNEQPFLTSNGIPIPFTPQYFERMEASYLSEGEALAEKYKRDGFLYLKSVLDPAEVLHMREQYFNMFDATMFKEGTQPAEGVFSGVFQFPPSQHGHKNHPASQFVQTPLFDHFTRNAALFDIARLVLGDEVKILPRRPVRQFYKGTNIATRAHADFTYLHQGTESLISMWVPLGKVDVTMGGIIYLKDSRQMEDVLRAEISEKGDDKRPISSDLKAVAEITGRQWLYADFEPGDVAIHSPFLIHATLDCVSETMRLSTDLRFALATKDIDPRWTGHWRGDYGY